MSRPFARRSPPPYEAGPIDFDLPCPSCGYNLRGLSRGQACPECGAAPERTRPLVDLVLAGPPEERARWRAGLALAALCVDVALLARLAFFVAGVPGAAPVVVRLYLGVGTLNAIVWIAAVWLVTPQALVERWPWMRTLRLVARGLSVLWLVGYACLVARCEQWWPSADAVLRFGDIAARLLGGAGALCTAFILSWVAEEAELEQTARRLNAAVWLLWFPTLLAQAFPEQVDWITLILLGMVLFFWGWVMLLFALGLHDLASHARWAALDATSRPGRAARVATTRRELNAEAEAQIRETTLRGTGPKAGEIPLDAPKGRAPRA